MACPATLCGKAVHGVMHICALVDSRDEQYAILLPFLREGLREGSRLATMVGEGDVLEHLTRLRRDGMDVERLIAQGSLAVSTTEQAFRHGVTPPARLAEREAELDAAQAAGGRSVRVVCEMDRALNALGRTEELLEYEARANFLALRMNEPLVCVYDVNRIGGSLLTEILCTHPKAIVCGVLHENPYFVSPQSYLRRLAERTRRRIRVRERRAWALRL